MTMPSLIQINNYILTMHVVCIYKLRIRQGVVTKIKGMLVAQTFPATFRDTKPCLQTDTFSTVLYKYFSGPPNQENKG